MTQDDLRVTTLGERRVPSPVEHRLFTPDNARVLLEVDSVEGAEPSALGSAATDAKPLAAAPLMFEKAGPREHVYFDPRKSKAAVVTCGGLCPGLNNVIRHLYFALRDGYGVPTVYGVRNGYLGLTPEAPQPPMELTADWVEAIHHQGGTMLGTSRGHQDPAVMVETLVQLGVNLFFPVGGDGTQRGAHAIAKEAARRGVDLAIVGIPKTIDNDILYCFQTFGFVSAVTEAERVIDRAHVEAKSVPRGVGLVKLMGRNAGFIAAGATVASGEVNFCLVPEHPFELEGPRGFLAKLERRLEARGHAVIVVAEGAGQGLMDGLDPTAVDASGNRRLGDIGLLLKERISSYFDGIGKPVGMKYFDPSYYIRSVQANATDSLLTERFARQAAHAAMAGKTDLFVGYWNGRIVHVPLAASVGKPRHMAPESELWSAVQSITGQMRW
ncbi:ATP-dependent 6-phosphofructokinase [Botrimarina mediterranea]|uniref:Pyrophosphate--fructose 6-phosphate 1-phosphotransferase n=1 Tax=Botrimarina mediterranea TaxID=2528022 RepID=A0A518K4T2_9BACT|nr:ATP-dependent 6-phosphofructokinase [Botrimarina mediterranea]QDV72777.1 Pyrophosphate--fructose 6-phosphate 1-phosphotransferase [Botrimarina mediterranea]QDV77351.1 Pyrophosphate--fructose 6-phosphate 1-phosphotransferase [Planctomycetes bacterium K2D]